MTFEEFKEQYNQTHGGAESSAPNYNEPSYSNPASGGDTNNNVENFDDFKEKYNETHTPEYSAQQTAQQANGGQNYLTTAIQNTQGQPSDLQKQYQDANIFQKAGMLAKGIDRQAYNQFMGSISGAVAALAGEGTLIDKGVDAVSNLINKFGGNIDTSKNKISEWNEARQKRTQLDAEEFGKMVEGDKVSENILKYGTSAWAQAPSTLLGLMTGGMSASLTAGNQIVNTTKSLQQISSMVNSTPVRNFATTLGNAIGKVIQDPQWQLSFTQEAGNAYNEALQDGATPEQASLYSMLYGSFSALIETGGGVEGAGGIEKFPVEVQRSILAGDTAGAVEKFIKSVGSEILEEEEQGALEKILKASYGKNTDWFSTENPDAVINPKEMLQTAKDTAITTALLQGGQYGIMRAGNAARTGVNKLTEAVENANMDDVQRAIKAEVVNKYNNEAAVANGKAIFDINPEEFIDHAQEGAELRTLDGTKVGEVVARRANGITLLVDGKPEVVVFTPDGGLVDPKGHLATYIKEGAMFGNDIDFSVFNPAQEAAQTPSDTFQAGDVVPPDIPKQPQAMPQGKAAPAAPQAAASQAQPQAAAQPQMNAAQEAAQIPQQAATPPKPTRAAYLEQLQEELRNLQNAGAPDAIINQVKAQIEQLQPKAAPQQTTQAKTQEQPKANPALTKAIEKANDITPQNAPESPQNASPKKGKSVSKKTQKAAQVANEKLNQASEEVSTKTTSITEEEAANRINALREHLKNMSQQEIDSLEDELAEEMQKAAPDSQELKILQDITREVLKYDKNLTAKFSDMLPKNPLAKTVENAEAKTEAKVEAKPENELDERIKEAKQRADAAKEKADIADAARAKAAENNNKKAESEEGKKPYQAARQEFEQEPKKSAEQTRLKENVIMSGDELAALASQDRTDYRNEDVSQPMSREDVAKLPADRVIGRLASWARKLKLGGLSGFAQRYANLTSEINDLEETSAFQKEYIDEASSEDADFGTRGKRNVSVEEQQQEWNEVQKKIANDTMTALFDTAARGSSAKTRLAMLDNKFQTYVENLAKKAGNISAEAIARAQEEFKRKTGIEIDYENDTFKDVMNKINEKYPDLSQKKQSSGTVANPKNTFGPFKASKAISPQAQAEIDALLERAKGIGVSGNSALEDNDPNWKQKSLSDVLYGIDSSKTDMSSRDQYYDYADEDVDEEGNIIGKQETKDNTEPEFTSAEDEERYENSWWARNKRKLSDDTWREKVFGENDIVLRYDYDDDGYVLYLAKDKDGNEVHVRPDAEGVDFVLDDKGRKIKADAPWSSNERYNGEKGNKDFARGFKYGGKAWVQKVGDARFGNVIKSHIDEAIQSVYDKHAQALEDAQSKLDEVLALKEQGALALVPTSQRAKANAQTINNLRKTITAEQAILDKFNNKNYSEESGSYTLNSLFADDILSAEDKAAIRNALGKNSQNFIDNYGNMTVNSLMNIMSEDAAIDLIKTLHEEDNNGRKLQPGTRADGGFGIRTDSRGLGRNNEHTGSGTVGGTDIREEARDSGTGNRGAANTESAENQPQESVQESLSGGTENGRNSGSVSRGTGKAPQGWTSRGLSKSTTAAAANADVESIKASNKAFREEVSNKAKEIAKNIPKNASDADKSFKFKVGLRKAGYQAETYVNGMGKDRATVVYRNSINLEEASKYDSRFKNAKRIADKFGFDVRICENLTEFDQGSTDMLPLHGKYCTAPDGTPVIYASNYDSAMHEIWHGVWREAIDTLFPPTDRNGKLLKATPDESLIEAQNRSDQYIKTEMELAFAEAEKSEWLNGIVKKNSYGENSVYEELFVEIAASKANKTNPRFSFWVNNTYDFNKVAETIWQTEAFQELYNTIEKASDGIKTKAFRNSSYRYGFEDLGEPTGNSQLGVVEDFGVNKTDDLWGQPLPQKEIPKSRQEYDKLMRDVNDTIEQMYQDDPHHNDTRATEWWEDDTYVPNEDDHIKSWHARQEKKHLTGEQIFKVAPRENVQEDLEAEPWNRMQRADNSIKRTAARSVLGSVDKIVKATGDRNAAYTAKNFKTLMTTINDVMSGNASVTEMYHMLENFKGDKGIGQIVDEHITSLFHDAANLERLVYANKGPESQTKLALTYKYATANAMDALATNIKRVDRVKYNEQLKIEKNAKANAISSSNNAIANAAKYLNRMQISGSNVWRMIDGYDKGANGIGYQMKDKTEKALSTKIASRARALNNFFGLDKTEGWSDFANGKAKGTYSTMMNEVSLLKMMDTERGIDSVYNKLTKKKEPRNNWSRIIESGGFDITDAKGKVINHIDIEGDTFKEKWQFCEDMFETLSAEVEDNKAATAYKAALEKMFTEFAPDLVATSTKLLGYPRTMYESGRYFPVSYSEKLSNQYNYNIEDEMGTGYAGNRNMKSRHIKEGLTFQIAPASMVAAQYIEQASNYVAFADLGADLKLMLDGNGGSGSLMDTISKSFGDTYGQWFKNYVKDMNGIKNEDPTGFNKTLADARQKMMQGALLGSVSVPIKQISSYWSSMGVLDPVAVAIAFRPKTGTYGLSPNKNTLAESIMNSRKQGSIDPDISQALQTDWVSKLKNSGKVGAAIVNATNTMDARTVNNVYNACILDVQRNSGLTKEEMWSDIKAGKLSEAGKLYVDSKFMEAVLNTQPVFVKQARNELARSDSEILRMFSTFRTQQTQNYNRLLATIGEYKAAQKGKDAALKAQTAKELKATVGGQVAAAMSISMLSMLADSILHKHGKYKNRGKDEDKEFNEVLGSKVMERFGLNTVEALAGTTVFGDSIAKIIIDKIKGDEYSKEFYGLPMGAVSTAKSAVSAYSNLMADLKDGNDKNTLANIRWTAQYTAQLFGIPLGNAYNVLNSVAMFGADALGYNKNEKDDLMKLIDASRTNYSNQLYDALKRGNSKKADEMVEKLGTDLAKKVKSNGITRLKEGRSTPAEFAAMLVMYADMDEDAAIKYVNKNMMEVETGHSYWDISKDLADGKYTERQALDYIKKYGGYDSDSSAKAYLGKQEFKAEYPELDYTKIPDYVMDGTMKKSEGIKWLEKTKGYTEEQARTAIAKEQDVKDWGYTPKYTETYEKAKNFYSSNAGSFSSPKAFGDVFKRMDTYIEKGSYTKGYTYTYNNVKHDSGANTSALIDSLNYGIQHHEFSYETARKIWVQVFGKNDSASEWGNWHYVKAA